MNDKHTISAKQLVFTLISSMTGVGMLSLPRLVAEKAQQNGWMGVLLGAALPFLSVILIYGLALRFPSLTLAEYSEKILGKLLGKLLAFLYVGYAILFAGSVTATMSYILASIALPDTPHWALNLVVLIVCANYARQGFKIIGRLNELLYYLLIPVLILPLPSLVRANLDFLLPIQVFPLKPILQAAEVTAYAYLGFEILLVIFPFVQEKKKMLPAIFLGVGVTMGTYLFIVLACLVYYGSGGIVHYIWPLISILTGTKVPIVERMEFFFIFLWVGVIFRTIGMQIFTASYTLSRIFKLQDHTLFVFLVLGVVFLLTQFIDSVVLAFNFAQMVSYAGIGVALGIPALLLVLSLVLGKKEEKERMHKTLCFLLLICLALLNAGCWDAQRVEMSTYPVIVGIDCPPSARQGEQKQHLHNYTYSLPILSEKSPEKKMVVTVRGNDVAGSLMTLQSRVNRQINLGQLMDIVFDETEAKEGLLKHLRFFLRSIETKGIVFLAISDGQSTQKLLNTKVPEIGVGVYLYNLRDAIDNYNFLPYTSLDTFMADIDNIGFNSIIPTLSIKKVGKLEVIDFSGLAIMKRDKMVGKLNRADSQILSLARGTSSRGIISLSTERGVISALVRVKTKVIPSCRQGKFSFLLQVQLIGNLVETPENPDITSDLAIVKNIEKKLAAKVQKDLYRVVGKVQKEYKTDVFHLARAAYIKHPEQFTAKKWKKEFPEVPIKIAVKVEIQRIGQSK